MLTTNTPALRIVPATPSPHPTALLAHGNLTSKEMFFSFGQALAAAGFDCYSVDQAEFGESPQPCFLTNLLLKPQELERALGAVDVFIGHSMGGGVGAWSVGEAGFRPRLLIGVGAPVKLGERGPPLLLLGGLFEEFIRPARLHARTNAERRSEAALAELVRRHVDLIYSAALRMAGGTQKLLATVSYL